MRNRHPRVDAFRCQGNHLHALAFMSRGQKISAAGVLDFFSGIHTARLPNIVHQVRDLSCLGFGSFLTFDLLHDHDFPLQWHQFFAGWPAKDFHEASENPH